ncbi:MAG: trypsin-like peptidase domain-containing protein [Verrucomicrobia bacterium]|nr:trypsin-like peptidase domain-containing protein [Verrucomicrobiota bacterium]
MKQLLLVPLFCLSLNHIASAQSAPSGLRQLSDSFAAVFEKAAPSVVVIESRGVPGLPQGLQFLLPDGRPYRMPQDAGESQKNTPPNVGSGFIFSADGHILTNHHVIDGASGIQVKLRDGRRFQAEVVGSDERSDLAVLKIDGTDFPVAELGDSDRLKVGELAFAIGTPLELSYTFTFGVVSAKGRNLGLGGNYDEFIQTDTSINPGNSGGPLCDIDGRVIGINTLISGNNRGVGFAIPINLARGVAEQLLTRGYVSRPWLGISIASLEDLAERASFLQGLESGVVVRGIEPGAPVQQSDLSPGDVITKVDGKQVALASDLQREILGKKIGQPVELEVWRNGRTLRLVVQTGEHPDKFIRASVRAKEPRHSDPSMPGLSVEEVTPESLQTMKIQRKDSGGVLVMAVEPFSAAAAAGLEVGDIITEAGGKPILGKKDFDQAMSEMSRQRGVLLLLERSGQKTFAILKP